MENLSRHHHIKNFSFISACEKSSCHVSNYLPLKQELSEDCLHVIFMHDVQLYSYYYAELFNSLRDSFNEKLLISSMDLVGHGMSTGSRVYIDKFQSYLKDFQSFLRTSVDYYHNRKVRTVIIADGLGATIAIKSLARDKGKLPYSIDSLICMNPAIKMNLELPEFALGISRGLMKYIGKTQIERASLLVRNQADNLSLELKNDPLVSHFLTLNLLVEFIDQTKDTIQDAYYIETPMLILLAKKQSGYRHDATTSFVTATAKELCRVEFFEQAKHDMLKGACASGVFQEIIKYIKTK